jgi:hypothetical protein
MKRPTGHSPRIPDVSLNRKRDQADVAPNDGPAGRLLEGRKRKERGEARHPRGSGDGIPPGGCRHLDGLVCPVCGAHVAPSAAPPHGYVGDRGEQPVGNPRRRSRDCCVPPSEKPVAGASVDGELQLVYPRGPMGGEIRPFADRDHPGTVHWIECVPVADGGGGVVMVPIEDFIDPGHAAPYLGVRRSTFYAWSPYLESVEKRGSRLIVWTQKLVNVDIPELENRLPRRDDVVEERRMRTLEGEVVRRGRHVPGCLRDHQGPCGSRPSEPRSPRRRAERLLRELGRGRKKKR